MGSNAVEVVAQEGISKNRTSDFFSALSNLRENDNGKLAVLRRNVGCDLSEARGISWFYGILSRFNVGPCDEEIFFLVSTLFAWDKKAVENPLNCSDDIGGSMRKLRQIATNQDSVDRRFGLLLDSCLSPGDTREMAFRLRQTVKLLLSKEIPISYPRLLDDLLRWQRYPRRVRQEWARSYYAAFEKEQQNNTTSQDDQSNNAINQNN